VQKDSIPVDLDKALDYGLKYRLELRQRAVDIESAKANLVRSSATNEFAGNLSLSYGIFGNDENVKSIYDAPTQNQDFSISFEVPIFDWGEKKSRIKAAEASVRSSKLSEEEEKKDIIIGIRQAYRNVQNQQLQIDIAQQNVDVAQLTYDINLERYENGDLTSMDLNLYQNQLSQKKIGLVDAMIAYKLALLDLKVQSMWDFKKDRPVLE
jgi:outer membrane protein